MRSLSSSGGGGGRVGTFSERKQIRDIKQHNLGFNDEKGDYLSFRGYFSFLKKDKEGGAWYPACPNKEEPCKNRYKVNQTTDGNWQCDRCHGTYQNCMYKWIFSGTVTDDTSTTWVSVFDEQAQQLFDGVTADQAHKEYDNQDAYDGLFAKANYSEWIMKCRVKNEDRDGESRLKTQVVRMEPVNYVSECREMIAALERM
jgi:replication factor A1